MTNRADVLAQRAALIGQLRTHTPDALRLRPQWLVWKLIQKPGGGKPSKVPFYASGKPRGWPAGKPKDGKPTDDQPQVDQGHELDRAALVSFHEALDAFKVRPDLAGVGFAFLPGDGLVGVDIDGAVDPETGEISKLCQLVMTMCPSYTERSVSGTGVHIILEGDTEKFKSDEIGLEVYCRSQYFTCTGDHWAGTPADVTPLDDQALEIMRGMVAQALAKAKAEREAERAAARQAADDGRPKAAQVPAAGIASTGDAFRLVNERALQQLGAWVPSIFPAAREHTTPHGRGFRVSSKALGRDLQEDLTLTPGGIHDFGTEQGMTAIDVVVEFGHKTPKEALHWLAGQLGIALPRGRAPATSARHSGVRRPEPPDEAGAGDGRGGGSNSPHPPQGNTAPDAPTSGGGGGGSDGGDPGQQAGADDDGGDKSGGKKLSKRAQANLAVLHETFAYQYGSKVAWDTRRREAIEIANLRHTYGGDAVKMWMGSDERWVVYPEQVMFEPGQDLGVHCINLFGGLPLEPLEGDCSVMIELLRHLCSTSEAPGMGPEEIADWVLRWCALPLQQLGAKLSTALVFHGPQGTGKNLFFDVVRDMYGTYGVMVGQTELEDKYNTWLSGKMLIIGDEVVSRAEMYHAKNRLKWIVTQESKIPIRAMHADTRWESNHANLVFLSNESQPLALEEGDRRFLVVYTPVAEDGDLYARVREFLANDGARKFLHFLQTIDLQDFNRHTKPPLTRAKAALIELGYKPAERFMHEWLAGFLPLPMRVCEVGQLYKAFRRWCDASGERFPPKQTEFTLQASRFAGERIERDDEGRRKEPPFTLRVFQVPDELNTSGRKAYRCWVPRGCAATDAYVTEGKWAGSCIDDFEKVLRGFMRPARFDDGDDAPASDAA